MCLLVGPEKGVAKKDPVVLEQKFALKHRVSVLEVELWALWESKWNIVKEPMVSKGLASLDDCLF